MSIGAIELPGFQAPWDVFADVLDIITMNGNVWIVPFFSIAAWSSSRKTA